MAKSNSSETIKKLQEQVAKVQSDRRGKSQKLTNLQTRVAGLLRYLEKNKTKFQTNSRPQFQAEVEYVRVLLPKRFR